MSDRSELKFCSENIFGTTPKDMPKVKPVIATVKFEGSVFIEDPSAEIDKSYTIESAISEGIFTWVGVLGKDLISGIELDRSTAFYKPN